MLFHITSQAEWAGYQDRGEIRPPGLATEGFVHLSRAGQLLATAARHYAGRDDLLVLALDPSRLTAEVVDEDLYGRGETFPHAYGALPLAAVLAVAPLGADAAGRFLWPAGLPRG